MFHWSTCLICIIKIFDSVFVLTFHWVLKSKFIWMFENIYVQCSPIWILNCILSKLWWTLRQNSIWCGINVASVLVSLFWMPLNPLAYCFFSTNDEICDYFEEYLQQYTHLLAGYEFFNRSRQGQSKFFNFTTGNAFVYLVFSLWRQMPKWKWIGWFL